MSIPNSLIQMEKDKYFMISLKCKIKKNTNVLIYKTETDSHT